nr:MAG TPA: hypothetical protein [Caudoviricetes sp.]
MLCRAHPLQSSRLCNVTGGIQCYARDGTPVFDFLYLYPAQEVTPRRPARFISRLSVYGFCFD